MKNNNNFNEEERMQRVMTAKYENLIECSELIQLIEEMQVNIVFVSSNSLTVTEIGNKLSQPLSPQKVNCLLQQAGYQVKKGKKWEVTSKGELFAVCRLRVFTIEDDYKYGISYDLHWKADIINELEKVLKVQRGDAA